MRRVCWWGMIRVARGPDPAVAAVPSGVASWIGVQTIRRGPCPASAFHCRSCPTVIVLQSIITAVASQGVVPARPQAGMRMIGGIGGRDPRLPPGARLAKLGQGT